MTVERLSRDRPPAKTSPCPSPSSIFRASLPGRSPRWPHTFGRSASASASALVGDASASESTRAPVAASIFSFPCRGPPAPPLLPAVGSDGAGREERRRRLLYSLASAELFARALSVASRRLPAVLEKTPEQCEATLWRAPGGHRRRRRQRTTAAAAAAANPINRVPVESSAEPSPRPGRLRLVSGGVVASVGAHLLEREQEQQARPQSNNRTTQSGSRECCFRCPSAPSESSVAVQARASAYSRSLSWPPSGVPAESRHRLSPVSVSDSSVLFDAPCVCPGLSCGHLAAISDSECAESDAVSMKKCKSSAAFSDQAAMDGKNKRRSISQRLEDGLQSPERPLRARSPGVVRDRRALSADRPLSSGVPAAPELHHRAAQADPGQSSQDPRKSSMTKVELLRQLTRRLRPSLSSPASPPPLPAANRPDPAASLPPIPVAPPRHARQPRKKASAKKDSATSTSDLEPHQTAPADCPAANEAPDDGLGKPERRKESLFSPAASSPSSSCVSVQQPSTNSSVADLFDDEIHLNFSKMNPSKGLMVGTYQQRTIPFRSASFSQVDVGADGTYNRRPRQMSITLKPVTYSIGRDQSKYQSVSLPRRLKLGATTAAPESPAPVDPTPEASEAPKQAAESLTPVREEQAADHVKDPSAPEASDDGLQAMEVDPLTAESEEKATAKMEDVTLDLSSQYETTEVSVTAEIRLSPVPQPVGGEHDQKVRSKSFDSGMKPLPVLDLLELNNHLLRLKAAAVAGRGNAALDRLADLEVASRLGLTPAMLLPSEFPSGDERSSESTPPPAAAPPDTPAPDPNERPAWLRELLRLQAGRARESNSSLSDEGADSGSSDSNPLPKGNFLSVPSCIHSDSSPSLTVRDVKNKRSPRLDRKRRRHSSFLIVHQRPGSQSDAPSVQRRTRKSDSARSLTFPLRNSSGLVIVPSTEDDERVSFKSWFEQTAALKRPLKEGKQETPGEEDSAGQDAMTSEPVGDERTATPETSDAFVVAQVSPDAPMPVESRLEGATEVKDPIQKNSNHRLTVSLSVTLEPTTPDPEQGPPTPFRSASPSNLSSDAESVAGVGGTSVACSPSPEKAAKIPILPRRYGLKRRPLRGPYGEMLEAEMNKSEFGKLYLSAGGKKSEDLSFLRELVPRLAIREAKSISPRPSSPMTPAPGVETGPASGSKAGNPTATTSRQNSLLSPPKSHSLDDSQLKIGYSNPAGSATGSPGTSLAPPAGLVKRKISTNSIPAIFAENKFETANHRLSSPSSIDTTKQTVPAPTHQRTSSSPCQLIQFSTTEGGFTSEDEPELLELTSICPLTVEPPSVPATATATQHPTTPPASELADESATVKEKPVVRVASIKRIRVSGPSVKK